MDTARRSRFREGSARASERFAGSLVLALAPDASPAPSPGLVDWLCCFVVAMVPLLGLAIVAFGAVAIVRRLGQRIAERVNPETAHFESMDVSSIRIALDHHVRPDLERKLDAMKANGADRTKADLLRALHEICIELRRLETSWLFAQVANSPVANEPYTEKAFRRIVDDSRAQFRIETVRANGNHPDAPHDALPRPRPEGPSVVVVTVVVAAKREIVDIHDPTDARALHALLSVFGSMKAHELVALEIIWSPADPTDRMSESELHRLYPELHRVRDETVRSRVFCAYCSAPFWAGVSRCPYCGGPAIDARHGAAGAAPRFRGGS